MHRNDASEKYILTNLINKFMSIHIAVVLYLYNILSCIQQSIFLPV